MYYFHVALPSEARPLIDFYQLHQYSNPSPFRMFKSDEVCLVISGQGKIATAAAISATATHFHEEPGPWINVGIVGHASAPIGEIYLVNQAVEHSTKLTYYPSIPFDTPLRGSKIITYDKPNSKYTEDCLYDMESSAFFYIGQQFIPAEFAQSIKIVSDNFKHPFKKIKSKDVSEHIGSAIEKITLLTDCMSPLVASWNKIESDPCFYNETLTRWKFSKTQQAELRKLLRQWQTISCGQSPWMKVPTSSREAMIQLKEVLSDPKYAPDLSHRDN
ncbi:MAG: hypothetical protein CME10_13145 [Gemmatimonadetes bacterium]|nr:hypothetical protein [Gemmatimonadota bacterium]